ncbi:MAG: S24 family peptidase [Alphaproteobacteria bacterium]|jgi:phage repressor protein C with HTH and peptisase S24 domain|nr:S24 family peptidase [Alphaproteobacteria bacterium]
MANWADIVRRLRRERRQTQAQFAAALGTTQATVSRWEAGRQAPDREQALAITTLSGRSVAAYEDSGERQQPAPGLSDHLVATELPGPPGRIQDLPILGHAEAGEDGTFLDNGMVSGYAGRPANLVGVAGAYALIVHNSSMRPRYEPREIVEVDPTIPVQPNDYVVVQTTDDRAFIKLLRRRTERAIILEQFNPPMEISFAPEEVAAMHLIVGAHRVYR